MERNNDIREGGSVETVLHQDDEAAVSVKTETTTADHSMTTTAATFVDYRRPPSVKVQPPSKYKLWLLVFVLVYLAVWAGEGANLSQTLRLQGWLSPGGAQFLELAIIVFVSVFGTLDLVVAMGTFHYNGKEYGLGPWLQGGHRMEWVHQTKYSDSFPMECLKGVIHILEEGFGMFNAAPTAALPRPPPSSTPSSRASKRANKLSSADSKAGTLRTNLDLDGTNQHDGDNNSYHSEDGQYDTEDRYTCTSDNCKTVVKIEHRINPDKMAEYRQWEKRIQRAAKFAPGLLSIEKAEIVEEELGRDSSQHNETSSERIISVQTDVELGEGEQDTHKKGHAGALRAISTLARLPAFRQSAATGYSTTTNLHTVFLTFENIYSLNDWMMSPRRKALMRQLEPLLAVPDQELIQAELSAKARDAFTNLAVKQGQCSPTLPPKKWKVWWLTTIALVITIRWSSSFMGYYLEFWGLNEAHPRLRTMMVIFVVTFLNSYVMTPFLLFLFHPWLLRQPNEVDDRYIWKTLEDGAQSLWLKFMLTFSFYGGCVIAWVVQTYS